MKKLYLLKTNQYTSDIASATGFKMSFGDSGISGLHQTWPYLSKDGFIIHFIGKSENKDEPRMFWECWSDNNPNN